MGGVFEQIRQTYVFSEAEKQQITDCYNCANDWTKDSLNDIKSRMREHLRVWQQDQCCYCRQELGYDQRESDLEHIVDKSGHWKFGFTPQNIALSCPACNSIKTSQEVLVDEKVNVAEYPTDGASFKIVHPYFDRYSDHITILANSVYQSKSDKGANLIAMCHLYRLASVEEKAKKSKMAQSLVYSLYNDELTEEERRQKMDEIKRIISDV